MKILNVSFESNYSDKSIVIEACTGVYSEKEAAETIAKHIQLVSDFVPADGPTVNFKAEFERERDKLYPTLLHIFITLSEKQTDDYPRAISDKIIPQLLAWDNEKTVLDKWTQEDVDYFLDSFLSKECEDDLQKSVAEPEKKPEDVPEAGKATEEPSPESEELLGKPKIVSSKKRFIDKIFKTEHDSETQS